MKFYTYDCEVTAYDWLFVFKEKESGEYTICHNWNDYLINFLNEEDLYCGFNSKAYDQFIVKAVVAGFTPEQIKKLSDYLIKGGRGWEYEPLQGTYFKFNNVDIFDDTQRGLSLKAIEGHLGMSIQETTVDFDLDRPWTDEELKEMIYYCKHDVDATERLVDVRREYLKTKVNIGKMAGLDEAKALSMTNAKLTAAFLQAKKPEEPWRDERQYVYPANLKVEYIPQEVFDFFGRMKDMSIPDDCVFDEKLNIKVGGTPTVIGYGGIHAAIPNYMWVEGKQS
jgi:hypothetical protein